MAGMPAPSESRWTAIERLLDRAFELAPAEQDAFLAQVSTGEPALAGEVARLVLAGRRAGTFLEQPAAIYAASLLEWAAEREPLDPGATLGPYEIVRRLGRGASATVYLAHDSKHRRPVAIKVLHPELARAVGPERFLREIEIAATLQHPHILPLFDSGAIDGLLYYVMPYVEGESLRDALVGQGRLPLERALRIGREVAGALDYSHRHGVVHRDVKPENILLQDGQAIVADFGIAHALDAAGAEQPTDATFGTGTPAYMSPEQATPSGVVDGRTDVYALGCVLYEMLVGTPPFPGDTTRDVLDHHARDPAPPLSRSALHVPQAVERAVAQALAKKPADRFATAGEFARALGVDGREHEEAARKARRVSVGRRMIIAAMVLIALAGLVVQGMRSRDPIRLGRRTPLTLDPGLEIDPAISPDGRLVAYAAGPAAQLGIFVRAIDRRNPIALVATGRPQRFPRWSPDGERLLFLSPRGIETVSARGGTARLVIPARGNTVLMPGGWAPDGRRFAFVRGDSVYAAALDGGHPRLLAHAPQPHSATWSPDGHWLAYVTGNRESLETGFSFGNAGKSAIRIVRADGGKPTPPAGEGWSGTSPAWLPDGRALLFISDREGGRDIYQAGVGGGKPAGVPVKLTTGLNPSAISLAADGRHLVYSVFSETSNVWALPIPSDSAVSISAARPVSGGNQVVEGLDVSPDGRWLAFDSDRSGNPDIYRMPVAGGEAIQLTTDPGADFGPLWSPDGRRLAFHAVRAGQRHVFVMSGDGSGQIQVTRGPQDDRGPIWLAGGREILYRSLVGGNEEVRVIAQGRDGRWGDPRAILHGDILQVAASPDGSRLAFASPSGVEVSTATGDSVRLVASTGAPGGGPRPVRVSWSDTGREVYFLALDSFERATIWAVAERGGTPRLLVRFDDPTKDWHRYGFRTRGGRFYVTLGDRESDLWQMDVTPRQGFAW